MAASLAQAGNAAHSSSANTINCAYSSNVTSGNLLRVVASIQQNTTFTSGMVTDSQGNTWTLDYQYGDTSLRFGFWSATAGSSAANTVTFNPGGVANRIGVAVWEETGGGAYGSQASGGTGTSTTASSGNFTPSTANGMAYAVYRSANAPTWGADWATGALAHQSTSRLAFAYDTNPPASAGDADATLTSSTWYMAAAWYDGAAAGGFVGWGPRIAGLRNRRVIAA